MKLIKPVLLLLFLALLDELLALWGMMDFTYQSYGWVPYLTFCGLYLYFYNWHWKDQMYIGAFVGLIYDFFFGGRFPVCFILYPLLLVEISTLRMFVRVDRLSRIFLGCVAVFFLEAIPVLVAISFKQLDVSLIRWFVHQVVLTVIVNGIFLVMLDSILYKNK